MGNLLLAEVRLRGVRPLIWHAFSPDAIPLVKREKSGVAGNDPEEWRKTVLTTEERQLFLPGQAAFSCLREAARFTRRGRGSIQSALAATLQVIDERVLIDRYLPAELTTNAGQEVYLDVRSVLNPGTRARNVRYRVAARAGWQASFSALWDRTIVSRSEFEAVLHDAGRLVGLGSARTIGYGRFRLETLDIVETIEVAIEQDTSLR